MHFIGFSGPKNRGQITIKSVGSNISKKMIKIFDRIDVSRASIAAQKTLN